MRDILARAAVGLLRVVHNCPSGALSYERHDGGPPEAAPSVNLAYVRENGPLALRGDLHIDGAFVGYRRTLCRCGASKNKPFCDNSHREIGFRANGEPATQDTPALATRDGRIEIAPQRNGPLRVMGNLEIVSGTGSTIARTTLVRFCRCGQSRNKPFCDGSHARVGFRSEDDQAPAGQPLKTAEFA